MIRYVHKKYGLKSRIIGTDLAGKGAYNGSLSKGISEYWPLDLWNEGSIFTTLELATRGWWPEDLDVPNSPLFPPTLEWRECPYCKGDTGSKGLTQVTKCVACGKPIPASMRLERRMKLINDMDQIGLVIFEGATDFGVRLLRSLKVSDPKGGRSFNDGDFKVTAPGVQNFGDAQSYMQQFIANTRFCPTKLVLWTALERRGEGEEGETDKALCGPEFPGKKLTTRAVAWFTDAIHVDMQPVLDKDGKPERETGGIEKVERKLFLRNHFPADTKPYGFKARTSAPFGGCMPAFLPFAEGGDPITAYFEELEKARAKVKDSI